MTGGQPRTREQRKVDTLAKLAAPAADVWVATVAVDSLGHTYRAHHGQDHPGPRETPGGVRRCHTLAGRW